MYMYVYIYIYVSSLPKAVF